MINSASFHNYLSEALQAGAFLEAKPLAGGDINQAFLIRFEAKDYFLKYKPSASLEFFQAEADGLKALQAGSPLKVPEVIICEQFEGEAFLVLEFLKSGSKGARFIQGLGEGLAELHRKSNSAFGWAKDNYIGSLEQPNAWRETWPEFYWQSRLEGLFAQAYDQGLVNRADRNAIERLALRLEELIPPEPPALLHGDLWSGNCMCGADGAPILIDPAVYYGHREMDLAMMQLFGGFSPETFAAYEEQFPLEQGFQARLDYHQLYPLLVHLNLFGASYLGSCRGIWEPFR